MSQAEQVTVIPSIEALLSVMDERHDCSKRGVGCEWGMT